MSGRVVAIVQARMGSTRLPGKVLMDIAGKTMLRRVLERLAAAETVDEVVVATSEAPGDDAVVEATESYGFRAFRGSEADVLDRFAQAAKGAAADVVVRVCADCPFIDAGVVDRTVGALEGGEAADYACIFLPERSWPLGMDVEALTAETLERAWREDDDPARREHVTPYVYRNPERFRLVSLSCEDGDFSQVRLVVDRAEDLDMARRVYEGLGRDDAGWREVVDWLAEHPDVASINARVAQNPLPT